MRDNYRLILLAVSSLIILAGILLFGFQSNLLSYIQTQSGLTFTLSSVGPAASSSTAGAASSTALDTSILQSPNFTALVNHAINFNFDTICWRPDTVSQTVGQASVIETATATAATTTGETAGPLTCQPGNSLPFVVIKTK
jgi:hypothetical protein